MTPCQTCGALSDALLTHHIVPLSLGGWDHVGNLVQICSDCHNKIHGCNHTNLSNLIREGLKKVNRRLGPPIKATPEIIASIRQMRKDGISYKEIARQLNLSVGLVHRYGKTG